VEQPIGEGSNNIDVRRVARSLAIYSTATQASNKEFGQLGEGVLQIFEVEVFGYEGNSIWVRMIDFFILPNLQGMYNQLHSGVHFSQPK